jgi:hypothetical protein
LLWQPKNSNCVHSIYLVLLIQIRQMKNRILRIKTSQEDKHTCFLSCLVRSYILRRKVFLFNKRNTRIFLLFSHGPYFHNVQCCIRFLGLLKKNLSGICWLKTTPMKTLPAFEAGRLKLMSLTSSEPAPFSTMTILKEDPGEGQSLIQLPWGIKRMQFILF